ncbi:hypothetical protein AAFF_G00087810 [Aldrovandia affinis]|uniref:Uncharacterized protein n=1 Tax=Aldrovandia affinis TaxID=143900 RepID=A0AAD7RWP6_9TELE|nr:hypothetical protein AAFF_G00087810 [Aldrovandia affinis]
MQTVGLIHTLEQCLNRMQTLGLIHTLEQCLNRMQIVGLIHTLEQCLNRMQTLGLIHTLEQCLNRMQTVWLIHTLSQWPQGCSSLLAAVRAMFPGVIVHGRLRIQGCEEKAVVVSLIGPGVEGSKEQCLHWGQRSQR